MPDTDTRKLDIYNKAMGVISSALLKSPTLYAANGSVVIPDSQYSYQRTSAGNKGTLRKWMPTRLMDKTREASDRERIVERSIDLVSNDPHAAGIVDNFAASVIGTGLIPIPSIEKGNLGLDTETVRSLQEQQKWIYNRWSPYADAGLRMNFGGIMYLLERTLMTYGEYIVLYHMIDDPMRPYNLALQVINPLRLRTPVDKQNDPSIKDGVELGEYGEPAAYWIKKSSSLAGASYSDSSVNFLRIPARTGHRWNVRHVFVSQEPEQVRGWPFFGPAMKFFLDLNDYLDAELVSNLVTSTFSLFIKSGVGQDPFGIARNLGAEENQDQAPRIQYLEGGQIIYGNVGEEVTPISSNRPGITFDPFTKIIKKAISLSINMPYTVAFKDLDGVNFAGFRSAMLDAWRVFMFHRSLMGQYICQPTHTMLMEEAYLRGDFEAKDFYLNAHALTRCDWRGSPKGDIEPVKAAQADVLLIQNNLKTRAESIAERGGELKGTFDQLEEEQEMMAERRLTEQSITGPDDSTTQEPDDTNDDDTTDDMKGAGNEGM